MKYAIPLGALLLLGAAVSLHRASSPRATGSDRRGTVVAPPEAGGIPSAAPAPPLAVVPPGAVAEGRRSAADRQTSGGASMVRLATTLDRELTLTAFQRESVEHFLKDREAEIKALHAGILRSGVIDLSDYEWRVGLMKDGWYRKIDALLDRVQHARFLKLVQDGFLNEGLAFTVEPGMTVLD